MKILSLFQYVIIIVSLTSCNSDKNNGQKFPPEVSENLYEKKNDDNPSSEEIEIDIANQKNYVVENLSQVEKYDVRLYNALIHDFPDVVSGELSVLSIHVGKNYFYFRLTTHPRGPGSVFIVVYDKNYKKNHIIPGA